MARLLAFASLLLLVTPNLAYPQFPYFKSYDSNDPFDSNNHDCIKAGHQNGGQLVKQYHELMSKPQIDANSPVISHLMEVSAVLRNDSTDLLPQFERNYRVGPWKNFTLRQGWQNDAMTCVGNLIVADEISMTLLAIRNGLIPAVRPPYVRFDFLVPPSNEYMKLLITLALEDMKTGKLVDQYFTTGEPSKQDVLKQLSDLHESVGAFKVEFQKAVGEVSNQMLEQGLVFWPEDEARVRTLAQMPQLYNEYIEDFKKKFINP